MPGQAIDISDSRRDDHLNVSLSAAVEQEPGSLKITYKLRNDGKLIVGVFNRIEPSNASYIDVEQSTLHVRKMALPVPEGIEMLGRPLPNAMQVSPGGVLVDEVVFKLPIAAYNPIKRATLAATRIGASIAPSRPVQVTRIVLSLGVFWTEGVKFMPVGVGLPSSFRVWPPGTAVDRQEVLSVQLPLPKAVTVLDY